MNQFKDIILGNHPAKYHRVAGSPKSLRVSGKHKDLGDQLLATGDVELIEGNTWHDTEWGVCNGIGKNKLGKILMRIREILKNREQHLDKYDIHFDV